jgi:hypothetical protein
MRTQAGSWRSRHTLLVLLFAAVLAFGGCQAIFTYSPLAGLQRPPSSMTPAQRLTYAKDALASGDTAAMKSAYDAIINDPGVDAQYTAAQLGIELSGIPTVLRDSASDTSNLTNDLNTIDAFIAAHNLDPTYMVTAAAQLAAAASAGQPLTTMDYAMASMGTLLGIEQTAHGDWNVTHVPPGSGVSVADGTLAPAVANVASLPAGDSLRTFIEDLDHYLRNDIP